MPTEISSTLHWKTEKYYAQNHAMQQLKDACIERVNWEALLQYASSQNSNRPCKLLDECTIGGIHLIRLLSFGDTSWIARVQLEPSTPATTRVAQAEIDAMELIRARTSVPIPKIFGYKVDDDNIARAAFTLMEFLPGCSAMDADGGYEVHRGQVPRERIETFFAEVARIQVEITSVRMPKIGTITRRADGSFDVGPLPKLGGPFSTATDFFKAWAKYVKFPSTENDIRSRMSSGPVEEILSSIHTFPSLLHEIAGNISANDTGPFPVYHPDFYHSNIIVNPSFEVLGVIDWEGTCTVPWEMVEPPLFLGIVAPAMDDPRNYDENGRPKDADTKRRLEERVQYANYVQQWEERLKKDGKLSEILLNPDVQGLAHAMKVYIDPGKLGFYDRILKPFTSS
ncbi:phosphotransferase family protein [Aspergillus undulatus]|uniref:phosphotransferase family protein n=1 Tax=Aspergillus undulatus TaxID=1810928 RepID=UPI003CCCE0D8